jgi:hypothetical protein
VETGLVHRRASVVLDANGNGSVSFDVSSANHKWILDTIVVNVSGALPATFPQAVIYVGGQPQAGLSQGGTWLGGQQTFQGSITMGAADTLTVQFTGGAPGATATAILDGTGYLWR